MSDDVIEEKPEIRNTLPTTTVYRIVKLEHLISDIENEIITFAHPTSFDDVKEYNKQDALFVQCWSKEKESPMMWELYSKDKLGIMIKFDVEHFKNYDWGLGNSFKPFPFDSYWRDIEYDFKDFENNCESEEPLEYLFHKRKGYEYEKECRWVIDLRKTSWHPRIKLVGNRYVRYPKILTSYSNGKYTKLIQVPFERGLWNTIISEIIIDPRSNDDYFRYVKELLTITFDNKSFNNINIIRSSFWGKDEKSEYNHNEETAQLYYFSKGRYDLLISNVEKNNNIEALKIWLFSRHDILFFRGQTIELNSHVDYGKINALLEENDIIINFYVMSYLILRTMNDMHIATAGSIIINDDSFYINHMHELVKRMFVLMDSFLFNESQITKIITTDFINNNIKLWKREGTQKIHEYLEFWQRTSLECQEYINIAT